jgi:hypothetical protein
MEMYWMFLFNVVETVQRQSDFFERFSQGRAKGQDEQ